MIDHTTRPILPKRPIICTLPTKRRIKRLTEISGLSVRRQMAATEVAVKLTQNAASRQQLVSGLLYLSLTVVNRKSPQQVSNDACFQSVVAFPCIRWFRAYILEMEITDTDFPSTSDFA